MFELEQELELEFELEFVFDLIQTRLLQKSMLWVENAVPSLVGGHTKIKKGRYPPSWVITLKSLAASLCFDAFSWA